MWGMLLAYALLAIVAVAALITLGPGFTPQGTNPGPIFAGIAIIGGCGGGLLAAVFGIWWMVLLFQYRKALLAAADLAHRTWMRPLKEDAASP